MGSKTETTWACDVCEKKVTVEGTSIPCEWADGYLTFSHWRDSKRMVILCKECNQEYWKLPENLDVQLSNSTYQKPFWKRFICTGRVK